MLRSRLPIASSLLFAVATLIAQADGPPCACEKGYYERVVTEYKKVCKVENCPTVVRKPFIRYEQKPCKVTIMVPKETLVKKPKVIQVPEEVTVTKYRQVPIKLMDPDTGCCIITYKDEPYPCKRIVMKCQTIMVDCKVCIQVPEERIVMQSTPVWDCRDETVMVPKTHCEMVPYQKTVRIPCPPPGPNYRVPVPLN